MKKDFYNDDDNWPGCMNKHPTQFSSLSRVIKDQALPLCLLISHARYDLCIFCEL